ncbi:hypothetical protein [Clavibacter michiganensis]|uniref:hypothetical protein n=1 Tax=Clavibacter michiganensis TaxID=28447 RepID=UPI00292D5FF1|nr:hypothetical protein [Clavibacter michiganensis]
MTAPTSDVDAWALTAAITPRTTVRVAAVDASGAAVNLYPHHRRTAGPVPAAPWAMYLAGTDHQFRLLGFDLDAKTVDGAAAAARDADTLAALLEDAGLHPLVCASGPTGGRHVWVGLAEGVDAALVATLARLVRHVCPTLDLSPLSNPATGCVRPPGAPHRAGGRSTVLRGDTSTLTAPTGTAAQVRALTEGVAQLVDVAELTPSVDPHRPVPVDDHSRLSLPGPRRDLPASAAAALQEDAAAGDASAVLRRILVGAVAARWRHADVAALVETAPGLEHVRTAVARGQRVRRRPVEAAAVLRRQWDRAVQFVAATPRQIGDDPTFDGRAAAIAADVDALQQRADTSAGRWARGGGPTDRRVLDALCVLALQAVRASVEADTRRLALLAGIGRETARTALHRLAADGWIRAERGADGPHGAHWTIAPAPFLHRDTSTSRSQADPRPAGAGAALRSLLLDTLAHRISDAAHDLFTTGGPGLGHLAGNIYARTTAHPQTVVEVARTVGATIPRTRYLLERLASLRVLLHTRSGWRRAATDRRAVAAERSHVDGRLAERAARYDVERQAWAWWCAEDAWMRAPRRSSANRRPARGQLALVPDVGTHAYGAPPRRPDGRLDWREARRIVELERGGTAHRTVAFRPSSPDDAEQLDDVDAAERLLIDLLGAVRVA